MQPTRLKDGSYYLSVKMNDELREEVLRRSKISRRGFSVECQALIEAGIEATKEEQAR